MVCEWSRVVLPSLATEDGGRSGSGIEGDKGPGRHAGPPIPPLSPPLPTMSHLVYAGLSGAATLGNWYSFRDPNPHTSEESKAKASSVSIRSAPVRRPC